MRPEGPVTKKILVAAPRGCCAGVELAVDIVERALKLNGP
ncbi:MAG TPA: 4-hydroxy-3-methylbut-2-enyl diphosphate reductase, partial [Actinomycetota bacterium]|nr:4-hydroxy-3-methylbut-2-enyl diphosphate reductase [Actinomycetota bacterium]